MTLRGCLSILLSRAFALRMRIVGPRQHVLRRQREGILACLLACFGVLVVGSTVFGQEQWFCDLKGQSADWRLSGVSRDGATISFPRDVSRGPDGSGHTTAVHIRVDPSGKVRGSLIAGYVRPKGSVPSLPAKGAAAIAVRGRLPEGGIRIWGAFNLGSIHSDSGPLAGLDGVNFLFPLAARDAAVLEAFLTKADQQGQELQLTILAAQQTIIQQVFKATGFQRARKTAVDAIAERNAGGAPRGAPACSTASEADNRSG
jgi:hypothetical protein